MPELEPDEPDVDPAFRVRAAILEAVDGLIRREAKGLGPAELEAFVAERNRVAELLGRPRFSAVDLLGLVKNVELARAGLGVEGFEESGNLLGDGRVSWVTQERQDGRVELHGRGQEVVARELLLQQRRMQLQTGRASFPQVGESGALGPAAGDEHGQDEKTQRDGKTPWTRR